MHSTYLNIMKCKRNKTFVILLVLVNLMTLSNGHNSRCRFTKLATESSEFVRMKEYFEIKIPR